MLNFTQLHMFITIVETGGFIAASNKLHRSQPAISKTIKNLESYLGFALFDRNQYRPQLTAKGEDFYLKALTLMNQFKQLENALPGIRSNIETHLSIGIDLALNIHKYIPMIQTLIATYPDTCFSLHTDSFVRCSQRLMNKEYDLCLSANHIHDSNIDYLFLEQIDMTAVTSRDYYAQYHQQIYNPKLSPYCMQIMIADTQKELAELNIKPLCSLMPQWLVSDMHTRKQLIMAGMGIGRLPAHSIEQELARGELIQLDPRYYPTVNMTMYAMRLLNREHRTVANHFWQVLHNWAKDK